MIINSIKISSDIKSFRVYLYYYKSGLRVPSSLPDFYINLYFKKNNIIYKFCMTSSEDLRPIFIEELIVNHKHIFNYTDSYINLKDAIDDEFTYNLSRLANRLFYKET